MKNLDKLPKITKLAKKFGTRFMGAEFINNGISFWYENEALNRSYKNDDTAIEEEITRLEKLLAVDF